MAEGDELALVVAEVAGQSVVARAGGLLVLGELGLPVGVVVGPAHGTLELGEEVGPLPRHLPRGAVPPRPRVQLLGRIFKLQKPQRTRWRNRRGHRVFKFAHEVTPILV